jgi:hypothetical protein
MMLASLAAAGFRPAEPASARGWPRWRQDAALAAESPHYLYCPLVRGLASFASGAPGSRA